MSSAEQESARSMRFVLRSVLYIVRCANSVSANKHRIEERWRERKGPRVLWISRLLILVRLDELLPPFSYLLGPPFFTWHVARGRILVLQTGGALSSPLPGIIGTCLSHGLLRLLQYVVAVARTVALLLLCSSEQCRAFPV